jgi:endonuclease/exonuclease/phosphatase family metal-dependent hydrolase
VQWDHVLADGFGTFTVQRVAAHRLSISDHTAVTVDVDW